MMIQKVVKVLSRVLLWCGLLAASVLFSSDGTTAQNSSDSAEFFSLFEGVGAAQAPLCPFGVNSVSNEISSYPVGDLRAGWYMNFRTVVLPERPNGMEYLPVIRLCPTDRTVSELPGDCYPQKLTENQVRARVQALPGSDWVIGNEPDRPDSKLTGQDAVEPDVYAQRYHELYTLIKATDPEAKVFAGSIVQATEVRIKYLDQILSAYASRYGSPMPVDGWNIHNYILNEKSCGHFPPEECWGADIPPGLADASGLVIDVQQNDDFDLFVAQIMRFREWMSKNGYRYTPLYLTEYGILMPEGLFTPDFNAARVNQFMTKTFDYLRDTKDANLGYPADSNRLVQRFAWYSISDSTFNGRLFDPETKLPTLIGEHYAAYTAPIPVEVDFFPWKIYSEPMIVDSSGSTITLTAVVANSGNNLTHYPVRVRFYNGDPNNGGQLIGQEQVVELAGCGDTQSVSVAWANVPSGATNVYVSVASSNFTEIDTANNTKSVYVITEPEVLFTPIIRR